MPYDYLHTKQAWAELRKIIGVLALFALFAFLAWLLGPYWAVGVFFLGSVVYALVAV